jgi:NADPH-dependent glutamate synthase beta subunit-like oxidoreductase
MMELKNNSSWEPFPISRKDMLGNLTGYWREMRPYREERLPPCRAACPAGEDIPIYIALASTGKYEEAFFKITEENPLPAICGRVCFHPCEKNCLRTELDGPVSIQRVERFLGDYGLKHFTFSSSGRSAKGTIAIVGSGPASLSAAYHARQLGHMVTLFESEKKLGGLLRYGIPSYRLPSRVLDHSIKMILGMGLEVHTGFRLSDKQSWMELV